MDAALTRFAFACERSRFRVRSALAARLACSEDGMMESLARRESSETTTSAVLGVRSYAPIRLVAPRTVSLVRDWNELGDATSLTA